MHERTEKAPLPSQAPSAQPRSTGPQTGLPHWGPWPVAVFGLALLLLGIGTGLVAARYGLVVPLGTLAGLALTLIAFLFPWAGLLSTTSIAILLPFGVLPVSLALTPTYLELTLLGTLTGWLLPPLARGDRRWRFSLLDALAWCFVALTLFSLLLGLGRGVNTTVLHNYAKTLLGLLAFFGIRQLATSDKRRRQFLTLFLLAAGLAALLGLLYYAMPDRLALDLLTRLEVIGYPSQGRVLRYVEDDPSGPERAIGTSVDPNSFGGMLALAAAIALGEVLSTFTPYVNKSLSQKSGSGEGRSSIALPRTVLLGVLLLLITCLYLTYSRAALGGFLVAAFFLVAARYRRLWWGILVVMILVAVLVVGLGPDHPAIARFRQGLTFQDLANQMRLAEFTNAVAIIQRYPVFGVGFGQAPDVDLSTGVSSLYLTIAERMGWVGLFAFLAFVGTALVQGLHRSTATRAFAGQRPSIDSGHRLALLAGVVTALAVGLLDHYFFNLQFPHMATLLWLILGLATVE